MARLFSYLSSLSCWNPVLPFDTCLPGGVAASGPKPRCPATWSVRRTAVRSSTHGSWKDCSRSRRVLGRCGTIPVCFPREATHVIHRSRQSKSEQCHPYLISLETLECHSSGYLVAEIVDVVIHSEGNASLSPKPYYSSPAYTWKIDGFSKLTKQSYDSGPFLYNDHIWYLTIYPKGHLEEKGKSVSLYLSLDDASNLTSSGKIRAVFYFDWVDQIIEKNHMYGVAGPLDFDSKKPAWGWSNFLSLDTLHEPGRRLLVNDTCIIKVDFFKCDISK